MPKPAELRKDIDELQELVSKLDEAHDIYMRSIDLEKLDANDQEKYEKEEKVMKEAHASCSRIVKAACHKLDQLDYNDSQRDPHMVTYKDSLFHEFLESTDKCINVQTTEDLDSMKEWLLQEASEGEEIELIICTPCNKPRLASDTMVHTCRDWFKLALDMKHFYENYLISDRQCNVNIHQIACAIYRRLNETEANRFSQWYEISRKLKPKDEIEFYHLLCYIKNRACQLYDKVNKESYEQGRYDSIACMLKGSNVKDPCVVCNQSSHRLSDCLIFKTLSYEEKVEVIKEAKACFRCLLIGHQSRKC